jgi:cellulose synthase/poly-beta-1,6-N-acetylglucosamine synthase-like glycosyltransferase
VSYPEQETSPDPASQIAGLRALINLAKATKKDTSPDRARRGKSGITVVVPARDEGVALEGTLRSLASQTLPPDRIVVVVNNSTDNTKEIARTYAFTPGAIPTDVLEMPGLNRYRKAGALNYGIRHILRGGRLPSKTPFLLVMDGDTELDLHFLKRARRIVERDPAIGGVSAACLGKPIQGETLWSSLLLLFQKVEYGRFAATRLRRNVHTMSGAGSFYRAAALNDLLCKRPDIFEERESNLVEDYETTLALKVLGWRVTSNQACIAYTDLMPTMRMLLAQRIRWVRGTVDEWRRYGWCRATCFSIMGMAFSIPGILYAALWGVTSVRSVILHGAHLDYRYALLAAFWSLYQGFSVRHMGYKVVLFEMALVPEVLFNLVRNYWLMKSVLASYLGSARAWK